MCNVPKVDPISCQIHYITLGDVDINKDVLEILKIIESSKIEYETSSMSTTIKGSSKDILNVINLIMDYSIIRKKEFLINISLSNFCGC